MSLYTYKALVRKVIDADTIKVKIDCGFSIFLEATVRLYGINAPEIRTRNKEEKAKGLAAKRYVQESLKNKEILVRTHLDKKGKFGRILADIYLDDKHFNSMLVSAGHAKFQKY